jgi:hypothetical protein
MSEPLNLKGSVRLEVALDDGGRPFALGLDISSDMTEGQIRKRFEMLSRSALIAVLRPDARAALEGK